MEQKRSEHARQVEARDGVLMGVPESVAQRVYRERTGKEALLS
jgi:hypothetical protein